MRYRITNHYATLDDDGNMIVEVVEIECDDVFEARNVAYDQMKYPAGLSGTTITLTVAALDDVRI